MSPTTPRRGRRNALVLRPGARCKLTDNFSVRLVDGGTRILNTATGKPEAHLDRNARPADHLIEKVLRAGNDWRQRLARHDLTDARWTFAAGRDGTFYLRLTLRGPDGNIRLPANGDDLGGFELPPDADAAWNLAVSLLDSALTSAIDPAQPASQRQLETLAQTLSTR